MGGWRSFLKADPLPPLLGAGGDALRHFVRRDLLGERSGPVQRLWVLPEVGKILKKQNADGSWPRHGPPRPRAVNVGLIEAWRHVRSLVDQYGMTREHPQVGRAAEFLFSCQTREGDIRGMLANQYATYYTGAILGLLIRAGYEDDSRVERGLRWLLSMRQHDGGWTIPILTRPLDRATLHRVTSQQAAPIEPDRSTPFSHHWTGMVLRAFAAHSRYRKAPEARAAAALVASRFFQPDAYSSYRAASYWVRFEFPFWWNNVVSALDSLSQLGMTRRDARIRLALDWLRDHQEHDGLWRVSYVAGASVSPRAKAMAPWVTLAICRVLRRFLGA